MRTRFTLFLSLLFLALSVDRIFADDNVTASTATYKSGKDTVQAYLCVPKGKGPFPAVILIHEWWGLNDWVKNNAQLFASKGYVALAVDLYRGKSTPSPDEAHELMRGLPEDRALRDLKAAVEYLSSQKNVRSKSIGTIGWCMGGGYSLSAAVAIPSLRASIICYGRLVTDSLSIAGIHASILGIFGARDNGIPVESVREFGSACKQSGKDISLKIYDDAGHAFMNSNNTKAYREHSAVDAWSNIWSFLEHTLSP